MLGTKHLWGAVRSIIMRFFPVNFMVAMPIGFMRRMGESNGPIINLESTSFARTESMMSGSDKADCKLLQTNDASGRLSKPGSKPYSMHIWQKMISGKNKSGCC